MLPAPLSPPLSSTTVNFQFFHPNMQNLPRLQPPLSPFQIQHPQHRHFLNSLNSSAQFTLNHPWELPPQNPISNPNNRNQFQIEPEEIHIPLSTPPFFQDPPPPPPPHKRPVPSNFQTTTEPAVHHLSATALLQKAAALGSNSLGQVNSTMSQLNMSNSVNPNSSFGLGNLCGGPWPKNDNLTRNILGLAGDQQYSGGGRGSANRNGSNIDVNENLSMRGVLSFTRSLDFPESAAYDDREFSLLKNNKNFGFAEPAVPRLLQ